MTGHHKFNQMTAQEITHLAEALIQSAPIPWLHLAIFAIAIGFSSFIGNYLSARARNMATKKDAAAITSLIEQTRIDYTRKIEELKGNYQMHAVALEKRLAVHQEAFVKWDLLFASIYKENIDSVCKECREWWVTHCVYLDSGARDAFIRAVRTASFYKDLLQNHKGLSREEILKEWRMITDAGDAIMKGAALPPLPEELKKTRGGYPCEL
jgi:hypothetical protein